MRRVVVLLIGSGYPLSLILGWALVLLVSTQSLMCPTLEGPIVECSKCGSWDPTRNAPIGCDGLKDAFRVGLSG
jgi:hypothetical protein